MKYERRETIMCNVPKKVNEYDQGMPQSHREEETQSHQSHSTLRGQVK